MTQKCAVKAGLVRLDWESPQEVRLKAMLWVLELKLYWNRETFGRALESTKGKKIVEISKRDAFWGCKNAGHGVLRGENHLGLLLMQVRKRAARIVRGDFTHSEGFLLP